MPIASVLAWSAKVMLSTYDIRKSEKYPLFLDKYADANRHALAHSHPMREPVADRNRISPGLRFFWKIATLKS